MVDDTEDFGGAVRNVQRGKNYVPETTRGEADEDAKGFFGVKRDESGVQGRDNVKIVGFIQRVAAENVDVGLDKFAEAATLGTFTSERGADLGDFQGKMEVVFVLDDVAREGDGVVEADGFGGVFGIFRGFD